MNIKQLPWRAVRKTFYEMRKTLYTVPVPDVHGIIVQKNVDDLYKVFRSNYFDYQELSYNYYNEDYNLARAEYNELSEQEEWQLHARLFKVSNSVTFILAHYEHDPSESPRKHLNEEDMSWAVGTSMVKDLLDKESLQYDVDKASNVVNLS